MDPVQPVTEARDNARMKRISKVDRRLVDNLSCETICDGCITIDVYVHLMVFGVGGGNFSLPHPTESVIKFKDPEQVGDLTLDDFTSIDAFKDLLRQNFNLTNQHLAGSPFRLNWIEDNITTTIGGDYAETPMDDRVKMTRDIGTLDLKVLDIYMCYTLLFQSEFESDNPPLRVGTASLASQQLEGKSDGIWMVCLQLLLFWATTETCDVIKSHAILFQRYDTIISGGLTNVDGGTTLTHELGHWLGLCKSGVATGIHKETLYTMLTFFITIDHTFQTQTGANACEDFPNDFIDDTPLHSGASEGIECLDLLNEQNEVDESLLPDTCPDSPGKDPVFNFMNYV